MFDFAKVDTGYLIRLSSADEIVATLTTAVESSIPLQARLVAEKNKLHIEPRILPLPRDKWSLHFTGRLFSILEVAELLATIPTEPEPAKA